MPLILTTIHTLIFIFIFRDDTPTYVYLTTLNEKKTLTILKKIYTDKRAKEEL